MKSKSYLCSVLIVISLFAIDTYPATWPIYNGSSDDLSSAFGPREYGPDGYDFHRGVDIVNFSNIVKSVTRGEIVYLGSESAIIEDAVTGYLIRYTHVDISNLIEELIIEEGEQFTTTKQAADHLDIKYYWWIVDFWDAFKDGWESPCELVTYVYSDGTQNLWAADHPMRLLPYNESNEYFKANIHPDILWDVYGPYVKCFARVDDHELDLAYIQIWLDGYDNSGFYINGHDLLAGEYRPQDIIHDDLVMYELRINCGDYYENDSDVGMNNMIGIDPNVFYWWDPYHTVNFKFYLDYNYFSFAQKITAYVYIGDIKGNKVSETNIDLITTIHDPPPGTPGSPSLNLVQYQQTNGTMRLEWSAAGRAADFYKVYRCLSTEQMSDDHFIGIASLDYYEDSDHHLVPGATYKYAVAGVNLNGEGANSNELTSVYGQELPSTINSSTTLDYAWYLNNDVTITSNSILILNPGTKIGLGYMKSIIVENGSKILSNGTEDNFVKFMPIDFSKVWMKIELRGRGGNRFNYTSFENGIYGIFVRSRDNIFEQCQFNIDNGNGYSGIYAWSSTLGRNSQFELNNCIIHTKKSGIIAYYTDATIHHSTIRSIISQSNYSGLYIGTNSKVLNFRYNLVSGFKYGIWNQDGSIWIYRCKIVQCRYEEICSATWGSRLYPYYSVGAFCDIYDTIVGRRAYYVWNASGYVINMRFCYWNSTDQQEIGNKLRGNVDFIPINNLPQARDVGANWGERFKQPTANYTANNLLSNHKQVYRNASNEMNATTEPVDSEVDVKEEIKNLIKKLKKQVITENSYRYLIRLYYLMRDYDPNDSFGLKQEVLGLISKFRKDYLKQFEKKKGILKNPGLQILGESAIILFLDILIHDKKLKDAKDTIKEDNRYLTTYLGRREYLIKKIYVDEDQGYYEEALRRLVELKNLDNEAGIREMYHLDYEYEMIENWLEQSRNLNKSDGVNHEGNFAGGKSGKDLVESFELTPNFPNPFNPNTTIAFKVPVKSTVKIVLLNILGQEILQLTNKNYSPGKHHLKFSIDRDLASGFYIVRALMSPLEHPVHYNTYTRRILYLK
jgi:hypothetical protein